MANVVNTWWAEKYRPKTIDEYLGNSEVSDYFKHCIEKNDMNHLLLYNSKSGTGKTSAAKILAESLDSEWMYINASDENSVEIVRDRIKTFASSNSFQTWKIIILDEFSYFSLNAQSALNAMMEQFSKSTRFIITCNYIEKVLPAIQSRCTCFHLESPGKPAVAKRIQHILDSENIEYTLQSIGEMVMRYYPDQRTIINEVQRCSISGKLVVPEKVNFSSDSYLPKIFDAILSAKSKKDAYITVRQIIAESKVRTFEDLYRYVYDNVDKLSTTNQAAIILEVSSYALSDTQVLDKEINVMALLIKIIDIIK
jgi:DNA polymerase III delta prime subunit